MALTSDWDEQANQSFYCKKDELHIPKLQHSKRLSLSDIIAATIGEDARSGDTQCEEFYQDLGLGGNHTSSYYNDGSKTADNTNTEDSCDKKLFTNGGEKMLSGLESDSQSQFPTTNHQVPEFAKNNENSCSKDSFFNDNSNSNSNTATNSANTKTAQPLDFSNVSFSFDSSVGFHSTYEGMGDFMNSLCEGSKEPGFLSSLCEGSMDSGSTRNLNSTLQVVPETTETKEESQVQTEVNPESSANASYDSDLEDSVHFVMPEDDLKPPQVLLVDDIDSQQPKKRRRSEIGLSHCDRQEYLLYPEVYNIKSDISYTDRRGPVHASSHSKGIHRARSFSGNITHRSSPRNSSLNRSVSSSGFQTPTLGRKRSFSGAATCSPLDEARFNTSLTSLLGSPSDSNSLSENPFFDDLKSTLLTECTSTDCPTSLLSALTGDTCQDVYARERNLHSRFSALQSRYPDEVRDLSSFYRSQSAEIETERFRELHEDHLPASFKNHLNQYYDDQLHLIMERVEKSLNLLTVAKRDIVTINRSFRPRPLLSRKAVTMMEEWYTRNYEHPYPSQTAVEALATAGEINPEQVKKWFANKRNRSKHILPPTEVANKKRKRQFSSRW